MRAKADSGSHMAFSTIYEKKADVGDILLYISKYATQNRCKKLLY
jgi:hypothetical protein